MRGVPLSLLRPAILLPASRVTRIPCPHQLALRRCRPSRDSPRLQARERGVSHAAAALSHSAGSTWPLQDVFPENGCRGAWMTLSS